MTSVYNENVICYDTVLGQNVVHNLWNPEIYDHCPVNNPNHQFQRTLIMATVSDSNVMVANRTLQTSGRYRDEQFDFEISAGPNSDYVPVTPVVFPYNVRIAYYSFIPSHDNIGDSFSVYLKTSVPDGTLTTFVNSGKLLIVSASVINKVKLGYEIILSNGIETQKMGECINIDYVTSTITVENDVLFSFDIGTIVSSKIVLSKDIKIMSDNAIKLAGDVPGNMFIPAGMIIQMEYKNISSLPKSAAFRSSMFV